MIARLFLIALFITQAEMGALAQTIEKDGSIASHNYRVGCTPNSDMSNVYEAPVPSEPSAIPAVSGSLLTGNFSANVVTFPSPSGEEQFLGVRLYNGHGLLISAPGQCPICEYNGTPLWFIRAIDWSCRLHGS